jgi:hypothetical protein
MTDREESSLEVEIIKAWRAEGRPFDLGGASLENLADTAASVARTWLRKREGEDD